MERKWQYQDRISTASNATEKLNRKRIEWTNLKLAIRRSFSRAALTLQTREKSSCNRFKRTISNEVDTIVHRRSLLMTERSEFGKAKQKSKMRGNILSAFIFSLTRRLQCTDMLWRNGRWEGRLKEKERMNHQQPNELTYETPGMHSGAQEGRLVSVQREGTFSLSVDSEVEETEMSMVWHEAGSGQAVSISE